MGVCVCVPSPCPPHPTWSGGLGSPRPPRRPHAQSWALGPRTEACAPSPVGSAAAVAPLSPPCGEQRLLCLWSCGGEAAAPDLTEETGSDPHSAWPQVAFDGRAAWSGCGAACLPRLLAALSVLPAATHTCGQLISRRPPSWLCWARWRHPSRWSQRASCLSDLRPWGGCWLRSGPSVRADRCLPAVRGSRSCAPRPWAGPGRGGGFASRAPPLPGSAGGRAASATRAGRGPLCCRLGPMCPPNAARDAA